MTDTETVALYAALVRAQGVFPPIVKNKRATGKSFSYAYASLDEILAAVRPALADNGLALVQPIRGPNLHSILLHVEGGTLESEMPIGEMGDDPQGYGSNTTYARRYAACALLGIATEEDDDGTAAQKTATRKRQPAKAKAKDEPELAEPKQLETIGVLISDLYALDPHTDWRQQARDITGGSGEHLAATAADILIDRLSEQRARLETARAEQQAADDELGDIEF